MLLPRIGQSHLTGLETKVWRTLSLQMRNSLCQAVSLRLSVVTIPGWRAGTSTRSQSLNRILMLTIGRRIFR